MRIARILQRAGGLAACFMAAAAFAQTPATGPAQAFPSRMTSPRTIRVIGQFTYGQGLALRVCAFRQPS